MHLDFLGKPLGVGDWVVWGVSGRRTYGLRLGMVTALDKRDTIILAGYRGKPDHMRSTGGTRRAGTVCKVDPEGAWAVGPLTSP